MTFSHFTYVLHKLVAVSTLKKKKIAIRRDGRSPNRKPVWPPEDSTVADISLEIQHTF